MICSCSNSPGKSGDMNIDDIITDVLKCTRDQTMLNAFGRRNGAHWFNAQHLSQTSSPHFLQIEVNRIPLTCSDLAYPPTGPQKHHPKLRVIGLHLQERYLVPINGFNV